MTENIKTLRQELTLLKVQIESVEKRFDEIVPDKEVLSTLKEISVILKDLKSEPENKLWVKIGIFLFGGFSFITLIAIIGALIS